MLTRAQAGDVGRGAVLVQRHGPIKGRAQPWGRSVRLTA